MEKLPTPKGIFWPLKYFLSQLKERKKEAKLATIPKICCIKLQSTYNPYPLNLSLKEKYEIIGTQFTQNKMILTKN